MTIPNVTVEFSPGEAPFDTAVWVDISTKVNDLTWSWGRTNELEPFSPGTATVILKNADRLFDPENTAGTYFGLLNPGTPFRIRSTTGTKDLFYGFVDGGWQQDYRPPSDARCIVTLVDLLAVISDEVLPRSALEGEVLADTPAAYWHLDETTGTQMSDSSGNGNHGTYDNAVLGADPLIIDTGGHSIEFPHVGDNRGSYKGQSLPTSAPCSIEAWVKTDRNLAFYKVIVGPQRDASLSSFVFLAVGYTPVSPDGEVNVRGIGTEVSGSTRVDDDRVHHVVITIAGTAAADLKIYVDGVLDTNTIVSGPGAPGAWTSCRTWTVGNTLDFSSGDYGFDGFVDEVAVYASVLSAARVLVHYEAGSTAFEAESSGERIDRVLDIVGVPAGMRDIATGDTFMGPGIYEGAQVGAYLDGIVESEQGFLWVDHADSGKIKFRGRYSRFTETRSQASQATFTDSNASSGLLRYERDGLVIEPNGWASVVNRVEIDWPGGKETVSNDETPPRLRTIRTEAPSPQAARSAGEWMIARYGQPQVRVRSIGTNSGASTAAQSPALDLRVADRVTVVRRPQNTGNTITNVLIVEGVEHKVSEGLRWETGYSFSDADTADVWIWGTSTWGETTTWG